MIRQAKAQRPLTSIGGLMDAINGRWHWWAMQIFLIIVLAHWAEHLLQAFQIWGLGWPRPQARGGLGMFYPWMVESEALHYAYAIVMLIGFILLRPAFVGRGQFWWTTALVIQFWHHFEHALLLVQYATGSFLFGQPQPVSIAQMIVPRVELHLLYNAIVFIPMVIAMYYHSYPPKNESVQAVCTCARHKLATAAKA